MEPDIVRAAVATQRGVPLQVTGVEIFEPGPGQVRVEIAAAGVCHSDMSLLDDDSELGQQLPAVLGHEGAGVVTDVGPGVTRVVPGDHVILNWLPSCGRCWFCSHAQPYLCESGVPAIPTPYARLADGTAVFPGVDTATFAEATVVGERSVVAIPADVPMSHAAVLGCAVLTGAGAVLNTANVRPGQSVAVIGLGGVGLSALQAATTAGAGPVVAIDVAESKRDLARANGATDFVLAGPECADAVRDLIGGRGADVTIECVGRPDSIRTAWSVTRRGGTTVVVGIGSDTDQVEFEAVDLVWSGRSLRGCVYGSSNPDVDVPTLLGLAADGRLNLDALITAETDLHGIDDAFAAMRHGIGGRTVVRLR
ncbi:Zn-dependent alcohol dehydrogenase [Amycolatopsis sp. cg5]|uniref:Zn-dependent alcohol dehydrogenase n=1 Tax=Amycolatopsis sp. cg5 TaxID=3238802 RepID=UPI0035266F5D